jgi:hypothetical protein
MLSKERAIEQRLCALAMGKRMDVERLMTGYFEVQLLLDAVSFLGL